MMVVAGAALVLMTMSGAGWAAPNSGSGSTPGGNNGTVKIDGEPFDNHIDNEPHVGCLFRVLWFGFDVGTRHSTVDFTAQAPTGKGTGLLVDHVTFDGGRPPGSTFNFAKVYDL